MRLIVTRPEPEATRTAKALMRLGHDAILSPMLDIDLDMKSPLPDRSFQAVLVTSTNAVRALAGHRQRERLNNIPLFAVGDHSALEAKRANFPARSAGGAIGDLAALAAKELEPRGEPILYAAGDVQAGDLAGELKVLGFDVETVTMYRARQRASLSGVATDALRQDNAEGVLLYSRRSADAFSAGVRAGGLAPLGPRVTCFCLSAATAEPLPAVTMGKVLVAERPDQISLFALIEREAAASAEARAG